MLFFLLYKDADADNVLFTLDVHFVPFLNDTKQFKSFMYYFPHIQKPA